MKRWASHAALAAAIAGLTTGASGASVACAQPARRSQLGTVTQWVGGAQIEIVYRRPVARGRALFGALVPWHDVWTPSADSAARITVSAPVEVNGSPLAAGTYGLWMVPDSVAWTVVFNGVAATHHLRYAGAGRDVLRVRALPTRGEHVETLLFELPVVDGDSAIVQMRWGTTVVPLTIRAKTAAP